MFVMKIDALAAVATSTRGLTLTVKTLDSIGATLQTLKPSKEILQMPDNMFHGKMEKVLVVTVEWPFWRMLNS
jgi:hypothetical protein